MEKEATWALVQLSGFEATAVLTLLAEPELGAVVAVHQQVWSQTQYISVFFFSTIVVLEQSEAKIARVLTYFLLVPEAR